MSALQERKRKEAEEALKQGNKYLEKTMFRWQPDYLSAGPLFEKAADAFRAAGDMEMAKKMFAQAAVVQNKNKSPFRAAQACENAAKVVVQQIKDTRATGAVKDKYLSEIKQSYESACNYYSDMGELGKAADALLKGAVVLEENGLADVKDLYMRACSLMEAQGKPHFAVETFRKTFTYVLKAGLYQDAVALLHRQVALFLEIDQRANIHKCYLSEIVLLLVLGDVAAADRTYMDQLQSDEYLKSDECALAEDLVRAFKQGNEELLQQTIRKQGFSFLDNQVGRLVRKLSIYGNNAAPPTSSSSAPSSRTASRTASSNQSRTGSASKPNPFAPTTATKDRYAHAGSSSTSRPAAPPPAPEHRALPPPPAAIEPVAAPATMESEFDFPTESMASLTVASEDDFVPSTTDFDFDSLQFSSEPHVHADDDVAGDNSTNTPATTGSSVQQPPHDEEEFDLT